jgi:hypothetical protein
MRFANFSFGSLEIDGSTYNHDVVIDRGEIRKRKKTPSKKFRDDFGHAPVSGRGHSLEMSVACGRQRRVRQASGDWKKSNRGPNAAKLNCWSCPPPKPSRRCSARPRTHTRFST